MAAPYYPPTPPVRRTYAMNLTEAEQVMDRLFQLDQLYQAAFPGALPSPVHPRGFDPDLLGFVEKLYFLRIHNVTPTLQNLYFIYARILGRHMLDLVLHENYILLVNNIFMRMSTSGPRAISRELETLISEAFMETISQLDDLVMSSSMFQREESLLTMGSSQTSSGTIMDPADPPATESSQP